MIPEGKIPLLHVFPACATPVKKKNKKISFYVFPTCATPVKKENKSESRTTAAIMM